MSPYLAAGKLAARYFHQAARVHDGIPFPQGRQGGLRHEDVAENVGLERPARVAYHPAGRVRELLPRHLLGPGTEFGRAHRWG